MGDDAQRGGEISLTKSPTAVLRIRVVPWRLRRRRLDPARIRHGAGIVLDFPGSLTSLFVSIGVWLILIVTAPLITFLLALLLLPFEVGLLVTIGLALIAIRFAGITRWTVVIHEPDGHTSVERHRNIARALRRVRAINGRPGRGVELVWA